MNTEKSTTEQIADLILDDVEQAPMSYISDGGTRAILTARRIQALNELRTRQRAGQILDNLADVLRDGHIHAQAATSTARIIRDNHAGDYHEGRARGYAEAQAAVEAAKAALAGHRTGRTRQQNAHAFAENIITGTYNTCHGDYHLAHSCTCPKPTTGDTP